MTPKSSFSREDLAGESEQPPGRDSGRSSGQTPTVATVSRRVEQILSGQFLKSLLHCQVHKGPVPTLTYRTDTAAFSRLMRTHLGKTILFTDNDSWTTEEIVAGYRSQNHIESTGRE